MPDDRQMKQDAGKPRVSVVMAVHNGERFLNAAVDSVLAQSFRDFELIIVDDGSTDSTPHVLAGYADPRVRVHRNARNLGLAAALNRGIVESRGAYIARLDADDEALLERLGKQVDFLDRHPEIGIVGAGFKNIDAEGRDKGAVSWPSEDLAIRWMALLTAPFLHSSVMMRAQTLRKHGLKYDESYRTAQDYELWTRLLEVTRAANIPEVLVHYRIHGDSLNRHQRGGQLRNHDAIALRTIRTGLGNDAAKPHEVTALRRMFIGCAEDEPEPERGERIELAVLYLDLLKRFVARRDDAKEVEALCRSEVRRVAYKVFRHPPFLTGWMGLAARMSMMDRTFPWWMTASALKGVLSRRAA